MAGQQMNPVQANYVARANLLQSGISMVKRLQPVQGALGSSLRIPLLRMGIMTGVLLQFTAPYTLPAGAPTATRSPMGPFNLANMVTYTDFAGVNRTKTNGFALWAAQAFKQSDLAGAIPRMQGAGVSDSVLPYNYGNNILNFGAPAASETNALRFSIYVPMAYDPASDLTGAILTQTNVGEHYITVDLAKALSGADPFAFPFVGALNPSAVGNVTVEAFQYYIQPQAMDANNLPLLDLSTIYGFEGGYQTTANIAAGQDTFINMPNNRSILSTLIQYEENGAFVENETNIGAITLLANSNTNFREMTPRMLREVMRNMINADLPPSSYFISSRRQPILTQLYANVQTKFAVLSANTGAGPTQFVTQYEVQYASGSPLPGVTLAA